MNLVDFLCQILCRRFFAGAEVGTRVFQGAINIHCGWMRGAEHAPRATRHVLEHPHGLAESVERGGGVREERLPVNQPQLECALMTLPENASRHGYRFAQQRLGFFEAPQMNKG